MTPSPAGASPSGGTASPAPGSQDPQSFRTLELVRSVVSNLRLLAKEVPGATSIVREMNDLAQKLQVKIIQSAKAPEPMAPPV